ENEETSANKGWHYKSVRVQKRLEHKKRGAREGSPVSFGVVARAFLESQLETELQTPHLRTEREAGDAASVAGVYVGVGQIQVSVIEHVEGLELELQLESLGEGEVLEQRRVGVEELRPTEAVEAHISKRIAARLHPRTRSCWCRSAADVSRELGATGCLEPVTASPWIARLRTASDVTRNAGHARSIVDFRAAIRQARSEWQTAGKVRRAVDGPAANQEVGSSTHVVAPRLPSSERQLIDLGENEHMVPVVSVRTILNLWIDIVVAAVLVVVGMLERIATLEVQSVREALLDGQLHRVVVVV